MTDADQPSSPAATPAPQPAFQSVGAAAQTVPSEPPPAWKPEPRQWSWKDLFTAPMLAFKPKCMVVSAVTLLLMGLWWMALTEQLPGAHRSLYGQLKYGFESPIWLYAVTWVWTAVTLVLFSLGATLVATFLKADLLDDEFLSFKEAWQQFTPRLVPALLVPLFLLVLVTGVWALIYLGALVCSIPYAGSTIYALLWPLAFAAAVLGVLVAIACLLSIVLFPGIIAVRRHGWFDNVVDTIEAVGTKPHLLAGSLVLTYVLLRVVFAVGMGAIDGLGTISRNLPGFQSATTTEVTNEYNVTQHSSSVNQIEQTEQLALARRGDWLKPYDQLAFPLLDPNQHSLSVFDSTRDLEERSGKFITWGPGLITAGWQTLIVSLLVGYCLNLALAGGLLTYLWVREDDYWDDEDLQDLDQLAKELEEEAKREDGRGKTSSTIADG